MELDKMKRLIELATDALDLCGNLEGTIFMNAANAEEYDKLLDEYKKANNDEK